jgi:hypothetical protein
MRWSRSVTSAGTISAPSAAPDSTFSIASARVDTRIGSTDLKSSSEYLVASRRSPPSVNSVLPFGTRLTNATFGFSGPPDMAKPMRSAIATG